MSLGYHCIAALEQYEREEHYYAGVVIEFHEPIKMAAADHHVEA